MLRITQSLKTKCPTKVKIINSGMHFPEFQYYNPFLIAIFAHFTQQGMNEERGKRDGAKPMTSDIMWLKMLCAQRMSSVEQVEKLHENTFQGCRNFLFPLCEAGVSGSLHTQSTPLSAAEPILLT